MSRIKVCELMNDAIMATNKLCTRRTPGLHRGVLRIHKEPAAVGPPQGIHRLIGQ
jgi:hypothetical protein